MTSPNIDHCRPPWDGFESDPPLRFSAAEEAEIDRLLAEQERIDAWIGSPPDYRRVQRLLAWSKSQPTRQQLQPRQHQPHQPRTRRASLSTTVKRMRDAGVPVRSARVERDGTYALEFGEPEPTESDNPWLADLRKVTKQ